jgi:hypothetical protein
MALIAADLALAAYMFAAIMFILSLRGLNRPESAKAGNFYGIQQLAMFRCFRCIVAFMVLTTTPGHDLAAFWRTQSHLYWHFGLHSLTAFPSSTLHSHVLVH